MFINKVGFIIFGRKKNFCEVQWMYLDWMKNYLDWLRNIHLEVDILYHGLGLHTQAKSRDRDIVGVQKKRPKAIPRRFQNHVMWAQVVKCRAKSYVVGPLTKGYFKESLFVWSPNMIKYSKSTTMRFRSGMVSQLCVRPTSKRWFLKII